MEAAWRFALKYFDEPVRSWLTRRYGIKRAAAQDQQPGKLEQMLIILMGRSTGNGHLLNKPLVHREEAIGIPPGLDASASTVTAGAPTQVVAHCNRQANE